MSEDLERIAAAIDEETPLAQARPGLHDEIRRTVKNLRSGAVAGA